MLYIKKLREFKTLLKANNSKLHARADELLDDEDEPMDHSNHQRDLTPSEMNDYNNELLGSNDQGNDNNKMLLMNRFIKDSQQNINNLCISSNGENTLESSIILLK